MSDATVNPPARAVNPPVAMKLDRPCKVCGCALSIAPDIKSGKAVAVDVDPEHRIYFLVRDKDGRRYAANAREFLWSLAQMRQGDVDAVAAMVAGVEGVGVGHAATCTGAVEGDGKPTRTELLSFIQDLVNAGDKDGIWANNWPKLYMRAQAGLALARTAG